MRVNVQRVAWRVVGGDWRWRRWHWTGEQIKEESLMFGRCSRVSCKSRVSTFRYHQGCCLPVSKGALIVEANSMPPKLVSHRWRRPRGLLYKWIRSTDNNSCPVRSVQLGPPLGVLMFKWWMTTTSFLDERRWSAWRQCAYVVLGYFTLHNRCRLFAMR